VKLGGNLGTGAARDYRRALLHDAFLAKHGQHPIQRFRVASTNSLLSTPKAQESVHDQVVQSLYLNVSVLQPSTEISNGDDLPRDRLRSIALFRRQRPRTN